MSLLYSDTKNKSSYYCIIILVLSSAGTHAGTLFEECFEEYQEL